MTLDSYIDPNKIYSKNRQYVAVKDGVIVGILQHPGYHYEDWRVYLLAKTPEENERNQDIREELQRMEEKHMPAVESFLAHHKSNGCTIYRGRCDDWITFIGSEQDLCEFRLVTDIPVKILD